MLLQCRNVLGIRTSQGGKSCCKKKPACLRKSEGANVAEKMKERVEEGVVR